MTNVGDARIPKFVSAANPYHLSHFKVLLDGVELKHCLEAHSHQGWALCYQTDAKGRIIQDQISFGPSRELKTGKVEILPLYDGPYRISIMESFDIPINGALVRLQRIQQLYDDSWSRRIPAFRAGEVEWLLNWEPISDTLGLSLYGRYGMDMVSVRTTVGIGAVEIHG